MELKVDIKTSLDSFRLDVSFCTSRGRTGILGASGSGKSMTLKSIAGIEVPDEGHIEFNGRVLFDSRERINVPPRKRGVGYLFQNYALFPNMTVEQNIAAGLKGSKAEISKRVSEMTGLFGLKGLERRLPRQLSGGQQQRVALARIIAYRPEVILLDEPFSALDSYLKDRLQTELFSILSDYPGMILMVSHNRDELYRFADELLILDRGRVEIQGAARAVFENPVTKSAAILTGCKNFSKAVRKDPHTLLAEDWGITLRTKKREVPSSCSCVGFRAHYLTPVYGERRDNCIPFNLYSRADLPFERNYYIRPEKENFRQEDLIAWFVQQDLRGVLDERGYPDYLELKEEGILFLTDGDPDESDGPGSPDKLNGAGSPDSPDS